MDAKMAKYPKKIALPKLWVRVNARSTWGSYRLVFGLPDHVFKLSWKWMKKQLWTCQKGVLGKLDQIEKFVYGIGVKSAQVALRKYPPCLIR